MQEERQVGGGRDRSERLATRAKQADDRDRRRYEDEREPDRSELGERLEIEIVRVTRVERSRPLAEPRTLVAPGAGAQDRVGFHLVPGDAPVVAAAVP